MDGAARKRGFEAPLFGVADEAAEAGGSCDGAMVEDEGGAGGGFGELRDVAGFFEDGYDGAQRRLAGFALEGRAVVLDGAGGDALDEALAEGRVFFADGEEEGLEGFVVGAGEEGFTAGGEGEAMAGPAGPAPFGRVGEEPLGFERLEVLAGGALGEEGTGGDFFYGGGTEPAEGDEDGPAGWVEEVEAGDWGHGGKVWGPVTGW